MRGQNRTAFILGAGASSHAGYPFVRTMGEELLKWMRTSTKVGNFDFQKSANFIE
jgi:hypothetical protein